MHFVIIIVALYCVVIQIFINYTVNAIFNSSFSSKLNITENMVMSRKLDSAIMTLKITSDLSS